MPMTITGEYSVKEIQINFEKRMSAAIEDIATYFIQACARQIESGTFEGHKGVGLTYRGQLLQNLRTELNETLRKQVISDTPYSAALNFGRQPGKMPPVNPLAEWFRLKLHLSPKAAKSAAWGLAIKFKKEGMDPKPFFTNAALETMNPVIIRRILLNHGFTLG